MASVDRFGNKVTIDASQFNRAMEGLSELTGKSMKKVIKNELAKILEKTKKGTKPASAQKINERFDLREGQKPSERLIGRVTLNGRGRNVKSIKPTMWVSGRKVRNPDWVLLLKKLKEEKKYAKNSRGLAKATWLKQAKDMGIVLKHPAYVAKAYKKLGRAATRTSAKEYKRRPYVILVKNTARVPMIKEVGGYGAFVRAMNGRQKFFETNVAKGVFKKAESVVEKYGVLVKDLT